MPRCHIAIPLLHEEGALGHWRKTPTSRGRSVEESLRRTLASLRRQTAWTDAAVHVAGQALPGNLEQEASGAWWQWHAVDWPAPSTWDLERLRQLSQYVDGRPETRDLLTCRRYDKHAKVRVGLAAGLADPECRWVGIMDHDDLWHLRLVQHCLELDGRYTGGCVVTQGYNWRPGEKIIRHLDGFSTFCGSCHLVRLTDREKELYARTGDVRAVCGGHGPGDWVSAAHGRRTRVLEEHGRPVHRAPFRAAIYVTDTGCNFSGMRRKGKYEMVFTEQLLQEFGLENTDV